MAVLRRLWPSVLRDLALNLVFAAWILLMAQGDFHRLLLGFAILGFFDLFIVGFWAGFVGFSGGSVVIYLHRRPLSRQLGL